MRNTYGKLMYLLMDAELKMSENNIDFVKPIMTVSNFLADRGAGKMIEDPIFLSCINNSNDPSCKSQLISKYESSKTLNNFILIVSFIHTYINNTFLYI